MIDLIPIPSDKVVGLRISGRIEKADMEKTIKAIEEKLLAHKKISIYAEIESFEGVSFAALVEDIKFGFPHLKDFEKKAVVSEKQWIEKLATVGDKVFPSIEVRHFSFDQKDEALKWVQT